MKGYSMKKFNMNISNNRNSKNILAMLFVNKSMKQFNKVNFIKLS